MSRHLIYLIHGLAKNNLKFHTLSAQTEYLFAEFVDKNDVNLVFFAIRVQNYSAP